MTPFHSHQDRLCDLTDGSRSPVAASWLRVFAHQAASRAGAVFRIVHRAIVTAKMRRLQRELMLHTDPENNAARFPQRPLILGDKCDS